MIRRTGNRALELWTAIEAGGGGASTKSGLVRASGIAAVLPEEMQGFLNGPVRVGEHHCVSVQRLVTNTMPGGYDEDIPLVPFNHNVLTSLRRDNTAALSLDRHKDCCIRRAISRGREPFRQQLNEGGHGGHGVVAGDRIGVPHLYSMAGVP